MTEFISEHKTIPHNRKLIYNALSNMNNLAKAKERFSHERLQDFSFDRDSCSFSISPFGQLRVVVVDKNAPETIQWAVEKAPVDANLLVRLIPENENETRVQLTVEANLNPMLKAMVAKPLQEGINQIADMLTVIPYNDLQE
jgi:hypothetical protein